MLTNYAYLFPDMWNMSYYTYGVIKGDFDFAITTQNVFRLIYRNKNVMVNYIKWNVIY